ncbi:MAG: hypothetical protein methR_P2406 [Methyloprofundus sp.]|nr:MAG: hypothetical protein methR_P2406 [Methyloprofundus sp.]
MSKPLIFLSHATRDKKLADMLRNLLVIGLNLRQSDVFYTSGAGAGIPIGSDFNLYMQESLRGAKLVVSLITPGFFESAYCMCELGYQSQIRDVNIFPLVFQPISTCDIDRFVSNHSLHSVSHPDCFDTLADMAKEHVPNFDLSVWEEQVEEFKKYWDENRDKFNNYFLVEKNHWDTWSTIIPTIRHAVQPGWEKEGLIAEAGYDRYSIFNPYDITFTLKNGTEITIDICIDGKLHVRPDAKKSGSPNAKGPMKGLISVMAPPLGSLPLS